MRPTPGPLQNWSNYMFNFVINLCKGLQDLWKRNRQDLKPKQSRSVATKTVLPGVVCLLQGIWPSFDENSMDHAGAVNVLTSTKPKEPSQGSGCSSSDALHELSFSLRRLQTHA